MLTAALVIAAIAVWGGDEQAAPAAVSGAGNAPAGGEQAEASPRAEAHVTTNLRLSPHRAADVVAVIPRGREAELSGRSADGAWVQLVYPPGGVSGWAPVAAFAISERDIASAPVRASEVEAPPATADAQPPASASPTRAAAAPKAPARAPAPPAAAKTPEPFLDGFSPSNRAPGGTEDPLDN